MNARELDNMALAVRTVLLCLMAIDRKRRGLPPDEYVESALAECVPEVNRRF